MIICITVVASISYVGVVHCNNPELKDSKDNERFSDHQYSLMKHNTAMNGVITVEVYALIRSGRMFTS